MSQLSAHCGQLASPMKKEQTVAKPPVPLPTPRQLTDLALEHPAHTGAGLLALAFLLKISFFIKLATYACLTLGAVFIWEAYKASKPKA
jgi:hypothetical protein